MNTRNLNLSSDEKINAILNILGVSTDETQLEKARNVMFIKECTTQELIKDMRLYNSEMEIYKEKTFEFKLAAILRLYSAEIFGELNKGEERDHRNIKEWLEIFAEM